MQYSPESVPTHESPTRRIFESAYIHKKGALEHSVRLDTVIDNLSTYASSHPEELLASSHQVAEYALTINEQLVADNFTHDTLTNVARLTTGLAFAEERFLAPFAFATPKSYDMRRSLVNDACGISADLLAPLIAAADSARSSVTDEIKMAYGAANEQTALALLNFPSSINRLALPGSTADDLYSRTDAVLYQYDDETESGTCLPISVKTNSFEAMGEKRKHPHDIVVSSTDMDNGGLAISRLLMRYFGGSPGISPSQSRRIEAAAEKLQRTIGVQLPSRSAYELPETFRLPEPPQEKITLGRVALMKKIA